MQFYFLTNFCFWCYKLHQNKYFSSNTKNTQFYYQTFLPKLGINTRHILIKFNPSRKIPLRRRMPPLKGSQTSPGLVPSKVLPKTKSSADGSRGWVVVTVLRWDVRIAHARCTLAICIRLSTVGMSGSQVCMYLYGGLLKRLNDRRVYNEYSHLKRVWHFARWKF